MNGRGLPYGQQNDGYWGESFDAATDWFSPVSAQPAPTSLGLMERSTTGELPTYPAGDYPSLPPGALDITEQDVLEALGPDADELLATANVDVAELIRLINAETVVMPPLVLPEPEEQAAEGEAPPMQVVEAVSTWKRRFLKGAVAAVIMTLTGAGGAAAAMDKSVTVEIDGHERTINTYEGTVGEVLADEGIKVDAHDSVSPSPQSKVSHGDTIKLDQGRLLKVTIDGEQREEWVRSVTVGEALQQLGVRSEGAWMSANRSMAVPENGMDLVVKTEKNITISDGGQAPRELKTHAVTIDELVKEQKLTLGGQDRITPGGDQKLADGAQITVDRITSAVLNVTVPIEPPVQKIEDDSLSEGEEKVEQAGSAGEKIVFSRVTTVNGNETERETVGEKIVREATPRIVRVGTKPSANMDPGDGSVWDRLVQCEAGGNWAINTGNGYYGGLQFDKSTWDAYGGDAYAAYPHQASREQQIAIATKVRDARGDYGAWPACSSKLGLS